MLHCAKTLFNQNTADSAECKTEMADKKNREPDNKAPEEFHCEEIDHNEIEIVQVRMAS